MKKEELYELLRDNLTIEVSEYERYNDCCGESGVEVTIYFDNKEICSDYVVTECS